MKISKETFCSYTAPLINDSNLSYQYDTEEDGMKMKNLEAELESCRKERRLENAKLGRLVMFLVHRLRAKDNEIKKYVQNQQTQLSKLLRALFILEGKLNKEKKLLLQELEKKDTVIKSQSAEIQKLREKVKIRNVEDNVNLLDDVNDGAINPKPDLISHIGIDLPSYKEANDSTSTDESQYSDEPVDSSYFIPCLDRDISPLRVYTGQKDFAECEQIYTGQDFAECGWRQRENSNQIETPKSGINRKQKNKKKIPKKVNFATTCSVIYDLSENDDWNDSEENERTSPKTKKNELIVIKEIPEISDRINTNYVSIYSNRSVSPHQWVRNFSEESGNGFQSFSSDLQSTEVTFNEWYCSEIPKFSDSLLSTKTEDLNKSQPKPTKNLSLDQFNFYPEILQTPISPDYLISEDTRESNNGLYVISNSALTEDDILKLEELSKPYAKIEKDPEQKMEFQFISEDVPADGNDSSENSKNCSILKTVSSLLLDSNDSDNDEVRTESSSSDLCSNFEEFRLDDAEIDKTYAKDGTRCEAEGAERVQSLSKETSTPSGYEKFLESVSSNQKFVISPNRVISNHRNVIKPKDIKYRNKMKTAICNERCTESPNLNSVVKYWTEHYL